MQSNGPEAFRKSKLDPPHALRAAIDFPPSRGANAGGYCHRSNPEGQYGSTEYENYVWFSDEMTPRYEYTWGGGNFFLSATEDHCRRESSKS